MRSMSTNKKTLLSSGWDELPQGEMKIASEFSDMLPRLMTQTYKFNGSITRELVQNGIESYDACGKDGLVDVIFDFNQLSLDVIDQGLGMDAAGLVNTFLHYMRSTKDNNADVVGGFGIGAKSIFNLDGKAVVTVSKDNRKSILRMFDTGSNFQYEFDMEDEFVEGAGNLFHIHSKVSLVDYNDFVGSSLAYLMMMHPGRVRVTLKGAQTSQGESVFYSGAWENNRAEISDTFKFYPVSDEDEKYDLFICDENGEKIFSVAEKALSMFKHGVIMVDDFPYSLSESSDFSLGFIRDDDQVKYIQVLSIDAEDVIIHQNRESVESTERLRSAIARCVEDAVNHSWDVVKSPFDTLNEYKRNLFLYECVILNLTAHGESLVNAESSGIRVYFSTEGQNEDSTKILVLNDCSKDNGLSIGHFTKTFMEVKDYSVKNLNKIYRSSIEEAAYNSVVKETRLKPTSLQLKGTVNSTLKKMGAMDKYKGLGLVSDNDTNYNMVIVINKPSRDKFEVKWKSSSKDSGADTMKIDLSGIMEDAQIDYVSIKDIHDDSVSTAESIIKKGSTFDNNVSGEEVQQESANTVDTDIPLAIDNSDVKRISFSLISPWGTNDTKVFSAVQSKKTFSSDHYGDENCDMFHYRFEGEKGDVDDILQTAADIIDEVTGGNFIINYGASYASYHSREPEIIPDKEKWTVSFDDTNSLRRETDFDDDAICSKIIAYSVASHLKNTVQPTRCLVGSNDERIKRIVEKGNVHSNERYGQWYPHSVSYTVAKLAHLGIGNDAIKEFLNRYDNEFTDDKYGKMNRACLESLIDESILKDTSNVSENAKVDLVKTDYREGYGYQIFWSNDKPELTSKLNDILFSTP